MSGGIDIGGRYSGQGHLEKLAVMAATRGAPGAAERGIAPSREKYAAPIASWTGARMRPNSECRSALDGADNYGRIHLFRYRLPLRSRTLPFFGASAFGSRTMVLSY